jgi:acetylglutamate kinase
LPARRRSPEPIDYGFVGDIVQTGVNVEFLRTLLAAGITPVVCPLTHDKQGSMLNSNADGVASAVAIAASQIDETQLVYCFEKNGVLSDVDDSQSVIPRIDSISYEQLKADGTISKGMLPKISSSLKAIDSGVGSVVIKHADNLLNDLGTVIVK